MTAGGTVPPLTQWLTTSQAARAIGISPTRVIQLADYGRLQHVRLGNGTRLYNPDAVNEAARARGLQAP